MESKDKELKKLKIGLAFKKIMDQGKGQDPENKGNEDASSFRKIERASGIRHASIVEIVNGKKNPAWTTIDAVLEGLDMTVSDFASIYDSIVEEEIIEYKTEIDRKKTERNKKLEKNKKKKGRKKK